MDRLTQTLGYLHLHVEDYFITVDFQNDISFKFCADEVESAEETEDCHV